MILTFGRFRPSSVVRVDFRPILGPFWEPKWSLNRYDHTLLGDPKIDRKSTPANSVQKCAATDRTSIRKRFRND